jgi:hypothetical protein
MYIWTRIHSHVYVLYMYANTCIEDVICCDSIVSRVKGWGKSRKHTPDVHVTFRAHVPGMYSSNGSIAYVRSSAAGMIISRSRSQHYIRFIRICDIHTLYSRNISANIPAEFGETPACVDTSLHVWSLLISFYAKLQTVAVWLLDTCTLPIATWTTDSASAEVSNIVHTCNHRMCRTTSGSQQQAHRHVPEDQRAEYITSSRWRRLSHVGPQAGESERFQSVGRSLQDLKHVTRPYRTVRVESGRRTSGENADGFPCADASSIYAGGWL